MNMIKTLLPFIVVFLIYNFVSPTWGIAALALLLIGFAVLKWPTILMLRGNTKYNKGDRAGGLALMEKAYNSKKLDSNMTVYYSYCLLRENQDEKAAKVLDEYIESGKGTKADICRAKHNKAIMLWKSGKTDEAFDVMKEAHAELPATDTYGTMGLIYLDKVAKNPGIIDEAEAFLREAYDYNSDDRTIAGNLGELLMRQGKLDEAENIYKPMVASKQASPTPYYNYAKVLMARGNYEDAEDMLNHALRYPFTGVTAIKREDVEAALRQVEEKLAVERPVQDNDEE